MFIGFGMWITLCFLCTWIPPSLMRKIIGFGFVTDITVHLVLQFMFGGTGEERVGILMGGVLFNISMHFYKYMLGYERFGKRYPGKLTRNIPEPEEATEVPSDNPYLKYLKKE